MRKALRGTAIKTIEDVGRGRDNNFNLLRMVAALAVLLSHSWPLSRGPGAIEPLFAETGYTLGTIAVFVFFAVSGFFITKSFDRRTSVGDFVLARVARLYPALIVATLLTILVIGPIFTSFDPGAYFASRHTWTFVAKSLLLAHIQWTLPGVFAHNVNPGAVNGSLWTLFYEVCCYAAVAVAGVLGLLRPRSFLLFAVVFSVWQIAVRWHSLGASSNLYALVSLPFFIGAACYVYRSWIPVSGLIAAGLAACAAALSATPAFHLLYPAALAYASLWFGFAALPALRRYNKLGDYSYGVYIYAFVVQQSISAIVGPMTPWALAGLAAPVTITLACLSWHFIERPALNHRHVIPAFARARRLKGRALASVME